jgi:hypothetical protein
MMLRKLMLRIFLFGSIFLAGLILGCFSGYIFAQWSSYSGKKEWSERNDIFLHRLEAIEGTLSCEDVNKVGLSEPRKQDGIIYYVNVRERDYQVIGFSTDSLGPLVSWSGADRQPCEELHHLTIRSSGTAQKRAAP